MSIDIRMVIGGALVLAIAGAAGPARAQDTPAPAEAPASDGSTDASGRIAEDLSREEFAPPVYRADGFETSGAARSGRDAVPVLPEGSFLSERRGILVPVGDRDWGFVFDADANGDAERPMLLQPSLRLAEMVRLRASRHRTATFVVSGRVMIHHGVNVLMPVEARLVPTEGAGVSAEAEAEKTKEANRVLDPDTSDSSIDALLARIDAARGEQDNAIAGSALGDAAAQARGDLVPEGTNLVSMRGRIVRNDTGRLVFAREGDSGPLNASAGEMVLLRCRNLEALEQLWQRHSDRFAVFVSGPVTVFEGSNYLLPLMYVVESRQSGELNSAQ